MDRCAGGVGTSEAMAINNRAAGAVGASGTSASGVESGFGLLRSRVGFPLKSLFGLRGNLDGRAVVRPVVEWYARLWADLALPAIAFNGVR